MKWPFVRRSRYDMQRSLAVSYLKMHENSIWVANKEKSALIGSINDLRVKLKDCAAQTLRLSTENAELKTKLYRGAMLKQFSYNEIAEFLLDEPGSLGTVLGLVASMQQDALNKLAQQAQELDMGYSTANQGKGTATDEIPPGTTSDVQQTPQ